MHENAADLHGTRCPVLALTRRQGTREHRSAVAALPILLIATRPSTDPSMLSKKPTTEDTLNSHARQNLLHGLGSLRAPRANATRAPAAARRAARRDPRARHRAPGGLPRGLGSSGRGSWSSIRHAREASERGRGRMAREFAGISTLQTPRTIRARRLLRSSSRARARAVSTLPSKRS
jgi:hypothetical protein